MEWFLAAQSGSPLDPTPMLVWADWLEECGDLAGAAALRGLAEGGIPSLHALALDAASRSALWRPDEPDSGFGIGDGFGYRREDGGGVGVGAGYGDAVTDRDGSGFGDGHGAGGEYGRGDEDDDGFGGDVDG